MMIVVTRKLRWWVEDVT